MKRNDYCFIVVFVLAISVMSCSSDESSKQIHPDGISKNAVNIQLVSHRGANRLAPENTYASATKAIESGAAYVEVDVRRSQDGVYYNFHDHTLDRTTNGSGLFSETSSEVIDKLDAGAWFAHQFAGETVPRLFEYLKWIKGKAKIYFDMKDADMEGFVPKIYELGLENDCFFWFSDWQQTKKFRELYPKLALKVNASSAEALDSLKSMYNPQIIECTVDNLSDGFVRACHSKGMKVMPYVSGNDWEAYRMAMSHDIDLVNLDCPDVFANMAKNKGAYKGYKLIAHRGGIVEGKYNEFDPASIQAAIDQGYFMLEIDVQATKDGVLIVNHDPDFTRFFNDPRQVSEMGWEEVQKLRPTNGRAYRPLLFEEVAQMCSGKIRMMVDIKKDSPAEFYHKLGGIMEKYDLLRDAYFIDVDARKYFWGKTKFSIRNDEINVLREKLAKGEDVACHYFFFEGGPALTAKTIRMCQKASITVVPTVNFAHYRGESAMRGARRDIEYLKACGVNEFQIDSDFDEWLPLGK
ncbi:MAG: glycerophosphodiester phosphodiesterase family protein [Prolixibacteraceae bacterium]|nr:glycerophosphodiester phosphodiesterase family protein [Prolixibacteraceae bacterium]